MLLSLYFINFEAQQESYCIFVNAIYWMIVHLKYGDDGKIQLQCSTHYFTFSFFENVIFIIIKKYKLSKYGLVLLTLTRKICQNSICHWMEHVPDCVIANLHPFFLKVILKLSSHQNGLIILNSVYSAGQYSKDLTFLFTRYLIVVRDIWYEGSGHNFCSLTGDKTVIN